MLEKEERRRKRLNFIHFNYGAATTVSQPQRTPSMIEKLSELIYYLSSLSNPLKR